MTKKPPKNKFFKGVASWSVLDADGDSIRVRNKPVVGVRTGKDEYSFAHKDTQHLYECYFELHSWELV